MVDNYKNNWTSNRMIFITARLKSIFCYLTLLRPGKKAHIKLFFITYSTCKQWNLHSDSSKKLSISLSDRWSLGPRETRIHIMDLPLQLYMYMYSKLHIVFPDWPMCEITCAVGNHWSLTFLLPFYYKNYSCFWFLFIYLFIYLFNSFYVSNKGTENQNGYFVASQDRALRRHLQKVPGV